MNENGLSTCRKGIYYTRRKAAPLETSFQRCTNAQHNLPGGRFEPGEDPFLGVKREIKKETDLTIEVVCPLTIRHFTRADKQVITMIVFLCKTSDNKVKLSREHSEYAWVHAVRAK